MISESTNQHYNAMKDSWRLARDFHAGDVKRYLRPGIFEPQKAYELRKKSAETPPHTRRLLGRLSNEVINRQGEAVRDLGPIRGDYMTNATTDGHSHATVVKKMATWLLLYGEMWLEVVPRVVNGDTRAFTRAIEPLHVPRWTDDAVIVTGERTLTTGVLSPERTQNTWTVYTPYGYDTYIVDEEKEKHTKIESASGTWGPDGEDRHFVGPDRAPTPPIFRVTLPLDTVLGVEVAQVHNAIFNLESSLDSRTIDGLTSGQMAFFGLDEEDEERTVYGFQNEENMYFFPEDARQEPIEVPQDANAAAETRIENKLKRLRETMHANIDDQVATSATEALRKASATASMSAVLAETIASAEETLFRMLAQAESLDRFGGPGPQTLEVSSDWSGIDFLNRPTDSQPDAEGTE